MPLSPPPYLAEHFSIQREPVRGQNGVVASQHKLASDIGAEVLRTGGNAVDAAIATALAVSVVEPWMSGIGGGGFMLVGEAATGQVHVVDFGMIAPKRVDPARYAIANGQSGHDALFVWPKVEGERNQIGPEAIAVPGAVAGFAAALKRFGSMAWGDLVSPAAELAARGLPAVWHATLEIAASAEALRRYPSSAEIYLPNGLPPFAGDAHAPPWLDMGGLAATLRRLAEAGPDDFYRGEIAASMLSDLQAAGSVLAADDLADYRAEIRTALALPLKDGALHVTQGYSGGPTFARAWANSAAARSGAQGLSPETYLAWADGLAEAFDYRLANLGHAGDMASLAASTTHLSVVDKAGNMVALTNTLLERFGSRYVLPESGVLMNNGMFWFDPRPGQPNSLAAGKRPLSNMCPVMATRAGKPWFALGASGGRRIVPSTFQLSAMLADHGLSLEEAVVTPRLDVTGGQAIFADYRLDPAILAALAERYDVTQTYDSVGPKEFAKPQAVMVDGSGQSGVVAPGLATALAVAA